VIYLDSQVNNHATGVRGSPPNAGPLSSPSVGTGTLAPVGVGG